MTSDVLEQLTGLGPFFALDSHQSACKSPWQPLASLLEAAMLERRTAVVARSLASGAGLDPEQVEARVAGSVSQLGLMARLVAPWLGLAALGSPPPMQLADLRWIPAAGSGFALSIDLTVLRSGRTLALADSVVVVTDALLAPVVQAIGGSPQVLWGNVASAANGAVSASRSTRPDLTAAMRRAATVLIEALPLAQMYTGEVGGAGFRRRSCCLLYRVGAASPRAVCGDCVLMQRGPRFT